MPSIRALVREPDEEYGITVVVGRQLGALENRFTYAGRPGHEIVLRLVDGSVEATG